MNAVYDKNNNLIGYVDRTYEFAEEDATIFVELPCGFKVDFWLTGLSNEEYIRRTELIKKEEQN